MIRPPLVEIRYRHPPDRLDVFRQHLLHDGADVKVTFLPSLVRAEPAVIDGRTVLEQGSPIVWFTLPGAWYDIARFHRADGAFTGIYANILTPVQGCDALVWDTTDLFLDVWLDDRGPRVLDEDEMEDALERGWIDPATAGRARAEAEGLRAAAEAGSWPPAVVLEWTLERALERMEA